MIRVNKFNAAHDVARIEACMHCSRNDGLGS